MRVRRGEDWVTIDTTLAQTAGSGVPAAIVPDLRFSAGGSRPLATIAKAGTASSVSLSWPDLLPEPKLAGSAPAYSDVPGQLPVWLEVQVRKVAAAS